MTQLAAPVLASSASMAQMIAAFNKFGASTAAVVNAAVEGGASSTPNIAASTVDRTNMRNNAKVGVFASESGFSGFVVTEAGVKGLQYVSASGLTATYSAGSAWVYQSSTSPDDMVRVTKSTTWTVLLTASSDNYVYIKSDASVGVAVTAVGGTAPTIPADSLLLSINTSDASTTTGTPVDKGPNSVAQAQKHYRSKGCWPYPSSTTNFRLPPGVFEVDGLMVSNTSNNDIAITATFLSGALANNVHVYYVAGNNAGSVKYGLTTSAPSAATVVSGATSGSTGLLQYRKIGSVAYRYLGSVRTSTSSTFKMYTRQDKDVVLHKSVTALSGGTATSFTAIDLSGIIPATATRAVLNYFYQTGATDPASLYVRPTGSGAAGQIQFIATDAGPGGTFASDTNSVRSIDYKVSATGTITALNVVGWSEDLD